MVNADILIETCRLRFRPWTDSDAEVLFKYASDPDVGPRAGWPPHQSVEESRKVIRDIFGRWNLKRPASPSAAWGIAYSERAISA